MKATEAAASVASNVATAMFCKDLMPFEAVAKDGMIDFFRKVLPQIDLPSPATLSSLALDDVYLATESHV